MAGPTGPRGNIGRAETLRELRRLAESRGIELIHTPSGGKGSHGTIVFHDPRTGDRIELSIPGDSDISHGGAVETRGPYRRGRGLSRSVDFVRTRPLQGSLEEVIAAKLGGEAVFRHPVKTAADVAELVRAGLPLAAFDQIRVLGRFTEKELQDVIPARTLRHRRENHERLTVAESDRALRLVRLQTLADMAFGNTRKADRWLRRPSFLFGGKTPLETAATEAGARLVETALAKIAWGAAA